MRLKECDWPFTLTLTVLAALTLVLMMADRSCQWRPLQSPREHVVPIK